MSVLGKALGGTRYPGGGLGSNCLTENQQAVRSTPEPSKFRDERGTFWLNPHEASARRGQARGSGIPNGRRTTGGGGNDVGGR